MKYRFIGLLLVLMLVLNTAFALAAEGENTMLNMPITEIPSGDSADGSCPG